MRKRKWPLRPLTFEFCKRADIRRMYLNDNGTAFVSSSTIFSSEMYYKDLQHSSDINDLSAIQSSSEYA